MKRYYLEKIGYKFYSASGYRKKKDKRHKKWARERRKYGFDSRETWNMDFAMVALLYERLSMYHKIANVSFDTYAFDWNGETVTQGVFMKRLMKLCENILTSSDIDYKQEDVRDIWVKWATISQVTWW